ncbi:site-2 protease family protein [Candidatus Woesearchaeota archaeon]|nr:site-2 protease family protein [Candidatus Woesearchaeota archaeon]
MEYNSIAAIVFILFMLLFLYLERKKIELQKIFFPLLYFAMYKTKLGLKLMDKGAKTLPKLLKTVSFLGVIIGFLGMILIGFELLKNTFNLLLEPGIAPGIQPVLPFEAKGVFFVPFIYWILAIFVIAVVHEFSHGLIARVYNIKIKSSGIAFLGVIFPIIPAAFVEPEERQLLKKSLRAQLSVFAAGPFANIITAGVVFLLISHAAAPILDTAFDRKGVEIIEVVEDGPFAVAGVPSGEIVTKFEKTRITSVKNFTNAVKKYKVNQTVVVKTLNTAYAVKLGSHPKNESLPYLGISSKQYVEPNPDFVAKYGSFVPAAIEWISGFLYWLFVLNLGIGLFNLLPLGPIDGGRMVKAVFMKMNKKKGYLAWKYVSLLFFVLVLFNVIAGFL